MATATALPNPTTLTNATRFHPTHIRSQSRSPSRSPVRTAQFRAQHLDPLLRNLSPQSTLQALQATETIQEGSAQDILTQSIADATPSEREIGIRAAFAAQKLREWRSEVSHWSWPSRRDCGRGAGFLPPQDQLKTGGEASRRVYLGYLPLSLVDQYEQRIDEIRDAMESLELDDIKDHVLAAHSTSNGGSEASIHGPRLGLRTSSYGRMRDFTALITATVIQALPDLAVLSAVLDTWDVRLNVLRQLPTLLDMMESTGRGVLAATTSTRYPKEAAMLNQRDFEETKTLLGTKISEFGTRIDKLLDLLEGQEDALPQSWLDSLENVELVYATWVVDAQRAVTQNESAERKNSADVGSSVPAAVTPANNGFPHALPPVSSSDFEPFGVVNETAIMPEHGNSEKEAIDLQKLAEARSKVPPPPLNLDVPAHHGHRREISEVSIADSAYSAMSGLSEAEISEARQTQVLPSPKVSMVDNPFAPTKEDMSFFGSKDEAVNRPPMVQRASTASFEIVSKDLLKKVDLRRSMSADLMAKMTNAHSPESTPSKALRQLNGCPPTGTTPVAELEDPTSSSEMQDSFAASTALSSPPLMVQPLRIQTRSLDPDFIDSPVSPLSPTPSLFLPKRSSKRTSLPTSFALSQLTPITSLDSDVTSISKNPPDTVLLDEPLTSPKKSAGRDESLESKIQGILLTLPTKIRLTDDSNPQSAQDSSASSTRASTPLPALTLSPAKPSRNRAVADTDVRVFHLHQNGQSRDAAPIKLFVRAVGENGERVMVRVGGGWADLGEYLKEYSAHHRSKSIVDGVMEVAQYPGKPKRESAVPAIPSSSDHSRRLSGSLAKATRRRSASQTSIDSMRGGKGRSSRSPSPPPRNGDEKASWTTPPVPPIPASYTVSSPRVTVTTNSDGFVGTTYYDEKGFPLLPASGSNGNVQLPNVVRASTVASPGVLTTTTTSTQGSSTNGKYTPLGAAGPKTSNRRSVTFDSLSNKKDSEAWVEGMVGKARAVSGSTVTHGPTTTTTTTMTTSTPPSRRTGAVPPASSEHNASPASSSKSVTDVERRRSRLSLADVSGIKRVFLRRKSEK